MRARTKQPVRLVTARKRADRQSLGRRPLLLRRLARVPGFSLTTRPSMRRLSAGASRRSAALSFAQECDGVHESFDPLAHERQIILTERLTIA
jgi:hypothetical protein